ncbi:MAG: TVP38/TMEM64 family protein [Desulfobacterales bacterium]
MNSLKKHKGMLILLGLTIAAAAGSLLLHGTGFYASGLKLIRKDLASELFIVLMGVLPAAGFPISPFLIVAGIKFGFLQGVAAVGATTLIHLLCAYFVGRSFLRPLLAGFLNRRGRTIPTLPNSRRSLYIFGFAVLPGLPYSLKNYLLAMTDLPMRSYLVLTWAGQMLIALPFIGLGEAASGRFHLAVGALIVLSALAAYLGRRRLMREFSERG